MPQTKYSRRIVVDASVARSAGGEEADYPTSKNCRNVLRAILEICHQVVMTEAISVEWNEHQSRFARLWRVRMAARKKLQRLTIEENTALRTKITSEIAEKARNVVLRDFDPSPTLGEKVGSAEKAHEAMLKDFHLIEAAMTTDQIVISLDVVSQYLFAASCQHVGEIGDVMWVHPDEISILGWLQEGAKVQRDRQLRHFSPKTDH